MIAARLIKTTSGYPKPFEDVLLRVLCRFSMKELRDKAIREGLTLDDLDDAIDKACYKLLYCAA